VRYVLLTMLVFTVSDLLRLYLHEHTPFSALPAAVLYMIAAYGAADIGHRIDRRKKRLLDRVPRDSSTSEGHTLQ
jgi:hypothetical protein